MIGNLFLRVHCFNNYGKNRDKNCPDLEIRYLIECDGEIDKEKRHRRSPIVCQEDADPEATEQPEIITEENSLDHSDSTTAMDMEHVKTTASINMEHMETTASMNMDHVSTQSDMDMDHEKVTTEESTTAMDMEHEKTTASMNIDEMVNTDALTEAPGEPTTAYEIGEAAADALGELDNLADLGF